MEVRQHKRWKQPQHIIAKQSGRVKEALDVREGQAAR